jgi:hypothetical protein
MCRCSKSNRMPAFRDDVISPSSSVSYVCVLFFLLEHTCHWRWGQYVSPKRRDASSHLCTVLSKKYFATALLNRTILVCFLQHSLLITWFIICPLHSIYPAHFISFYLIAMMAVNECNELRNPLSCNFCVFHMFRFKYYRKFCKHCIKGNVMLGVTMSLWPCCTVLLGGHQKSPGKNPSQIWIGKQALKLRYINT